MSLPELLDRERAKCAADEKKSLSLLAEKRREAVSPDLVKWLLAIAAPTPTEELLMAMYEWSCGDMGQENMVFDPQQDWTGGDPQVAVDLCSQISGIVELKTASARTVELGWVTQVTEEENADQYYAECSVQWGHLNAWIRRVLDWDRQPRKRLAALLLIAGGRVPDVFSPFTTPLDKTETPPTEQELYDLLHEYPQFTDIKLKACRPRQLTREMERYHRAQIQSAVAHWQLRARIFLGLELSGAREAVVKTKKPELLNLLDGTHLEEDSQDE